MVHALADAACIFNVYLYVREFYAASDLIAITFHLDGALIFFRRVSLLRCTRGADAGAGGTESVGRCDFKRESRRTLLQLVGCLVSSAI